MVEPLAGWRSRAKTRAVIVELVGLPGVGKSHLCRTLRDRHVAGRGAPIRVLVEVEPTKLGIVHGMTGKLWRASLFAAMHTGTAWKLVRVVDSRGGILRRGRPSKFVNLLSEAARSARVPRSEILISEQGVLQAVWSLQMRSDESVYAELLEPLSRWLPKRVVLVKIDRAEYESRLSRREGGRSHFDQLEAERLPDAIERGVRHTHDILDGWARHVTDADRLDFWNDRSARADDIVEWLNDREPARTDAPSR